MNRFINMLLMLLAFPVMIITIFIGFDLPMTWMGTSGANMPYRFEILIAFSVLMLIVILRRSVRRWMGLRLVNQISRYRWNSSVSSARVQRVQVYNSLESLVMLSFGLAMYWLTEEAWMVTVVMFIGALDSLVFAQMGRAGKFRVGLTSKALLIADREVIVIYFTGLRRVTQHQQTIYFDFIKDLQLRFPENCIKEEEKEVFFESLKSVLDPERVYFSKKLAE